MPPDDAACYSSDIYQNTLSYLEFPMFLPGPMELLIIAAIFLMLIGVPLLIAVLVIYLVKSTKSPEGDDRHD
ncbi:hypothetical protein CA54_23780 [Symmachiella macrocystis]|uniref:Uncharacterized protein n=1 Tax=Symmachiella macrocystis TaxID=2527985 RepID=A0A5C6BN17_9PLAN|nr:twin-arginine translocase TatA/TatE family subunit [Symmachiella macrocystis]TWU13543.1 hypothetical protein CA54_23780 [Symmachiella macrocystis]